MTAELEALKRAVDAVGGQNALARKLQSECGLSVQQGHVWHWLHKSKKAPAEHVLAIEKVSKVSRFDLRPDVFGMAPAGKPPAHEARP